MEIDNTIIRLAGVGMNWDRFVALRDVDFDVHEGDFVAITGPNGGGKTTLLRIILKLLKPTSGSVKYFNHGVEVDRLAIGYLPQKNMIDHRFPIDVKQVVASGLLGMKGLSKEKAAELVDETLNLVQLQDKRCNAIGELSGGQLQRALLGRALISSPSVLLLDEPLSYIDKHFEHEIYSIIERIKRSTTILLVSHEISQIASMANRHIIVDRAVHDCPATCHYVPHHHNCDE